MSHQRGAGASGTPDITVSADGPARVLIGTSASYTFRACNPTATDGYNLSYRTVLPAGVGFDSATPAATTVLANKPSAGLTTVIWENTSDLLSGACTSISLAVSTDADNDVATLPVGTNFDITPGAYVNSDAFYIPDFDANGVPVSGDFLHRVRRIDAEDLTRRRIHPRQGRRKQRRGRTDVASMVRTPRPTPSQ